MLSLLLNPDAVLGFTTGLVAGALAATGLIHAGFRAHERRVHLETERTRQHIRAAEQARAWQRAGAANDDASHRTARSAMRGGAR